MKSVVSSSSRRQFVRTFALATAFSSLAGRDWMAAIVGQAEASQSSALGAFQLSLTSYPVLQQANGSVRLKVPGMPVTFREIIVTRLANNQFYAVTSMCTHMGCTVNTYNASMGALPCPCHGSRFHADGTVLNGPAATALTRYTTQYDGADLLTVFIPGLGYSIQNPVVVVGPPDRFSLSFPTMSGLTYEVHFRAAIDLGPWTRIPFSLNPAGPLVETSLSGNGSVATVYVEYTGTNGFFAIARA
jgi:Rieske Fe-S protein